MNRSDVAARLRAGASLTGLLVRMPAEPIVEVAGLAGLDLVVIDLEHGPGDGIALQQHLMAGRSGGAAVLVRVGDATDVRRCLDLGAEGIVVPHVRSAADAEAVITETRYPTRGRRGFAAYTRAADYGLRAAAEHLKASQAPVVIAMVEDVDGVAAVDEIVGVDGIDGVLVGPADLAVSLGAIDAAPIVETAVRRCQEACRSVGKVAVTIASSIPAARQERAAGSQLVLVNLQAALTELIREIVAGQPEPSGPPDPLVVLSGMLADASAWADVVAALSPGRAVQHARIDLDDSVAGMAESVLAAAPPRFALAGHSLGGIVAMEVARRAPHRVTRLAVLQTSAVEGDAQQAAAWTSLRERLADGQFAEVAIDLVRSTLPRGRQDDDRLVRRGLAMARTVGSAGLERQLIAQATRPRALDHIGQFSGPMLVVSGDLDTVSPRARQEEIVAAVDGAVHRVIEDCGHHALLERPEAVAALLDAWLEPSWGVTTSTPPASNLNTTP